MSPPPKTPTPRRFLPPKRPPASQTPLPQGSQFQSTPRFGSSSVSRPTQRAHSIEDVDEDGEDSSPVTDEGHVEAARRVLDLDVDSITSGSQLTDHSIGEAEHAHQVDFVDRYDPSSSAERDVKRRRLSISPGSMESVDDDAGTPTNRSVEEDFETRDEASHSRNVEQTQPVFRSAPRFKLADVDESAMADILPVAFSPQHRRTKYLAGGLAAQLQSWLSEIRGWDGEPQSKLRMVVEEVRPGAHMYLTRGRKEAGEGGKGYVLAGEGKLTGLERRADVKVGCVVLCEEPVWEVDLMDESWTVVCNWSVVS